MAVVATAEGVEVLNGAGRSGRGTDPASVPDTATASCLPLGDAR